MGSLVVPVVYELFVGWEHPSFEFVGFVESFYLTDRGWSPYTCDDMLDAVSTAELCEG